MSNGRLFILGFFLFWLLNKEWFFYVVTKKSYVIPRTFITVRTLIGHSRVHHFNGWMVYKEKQFHWKFAESKSAHYRVTVSQRKQCNKIACVYYFCSSENVLFWLIQTHTVNNKYSPKWRLYGAKHDTKSWHPPY